jgi:hypothetical protein
MKEKMSMTPPVVGASSLLVIFGVLCLVMFSLLSLNTVLAEKRLSDSAAQVTADWYRADLEAQEIFARLRAGEPVSGVEQNENIYTYSVAITDRQTLLVALRESEGNWEVLSWYARAHPEETDTALPVWQGQ